MSSSLNVVYIYAGRQGDLLYLLPAIGETFPGTSFLVTLC